MMLAVFSDVHGNLEALRAVLQDMEEQGADELICLGDFIGYGPDPEAVCHIIEERGIPSVLGNHELGLKNRDIRAWFNPVSLKALDITRQLLPPPCREFAISHPQAIVRDDMRFVHGCPPDKVLTYLFELEDEELLEIIQEMPESLCFVGHTHELGLVTLKDGDLTREEIEPGERVLEPGNKYIVNIGSVGQPRDGVDKRAKYALWEPETRRLVIRAVTYDAQATVDKMRALGMPDSYAVKLL